MARVNSSINSPALQAISLEVQPETQRLVVVAVLVVHPSSGLGELEVHSVPQALLDSKPLEVVADHALVQVALEAMVS